LCSGRRDADGDLDPTAPSAVVIDVTIIVVITATMNNLSKLAMKRSCVEALPEAVR
jgi:hypothetical protein